MMELRSPELLIEIAERHKWICERMVRRRSLLDIAARADLAAVEAALVEEEAREREADPRYWQSLKTELEQLRRRRLHE